jgi:hypothetical protein
MNFTSFKLVTASVLFVALSACGGGGGGSASTVDSNPSFTGSINSEKPLILQAANSFGADTALNNFTYTATAGERMFVRAILATPFSDTQSARCASNPGAYATQIRVYDAGGQQVTYSCGEDVMVTFANDGAYRFNFEYPANGGGSFYAASLPSIMPVQFSSIGDGSPNVPKLLNTTSGNTLDSNPFKDYYWVQAAQGEKIDVSVSLQVPLSATQLSRCAANAEGTNNAQLRVFDATLSNQIAVICGNSMQFIAPTTGTFIIQADYGVNGGMLYAARF